MKRENQIVYYILHIRFRCQKINKSNVEIFLLVCVAFPSYRLLFQFINYNRHLLFCFEDITVISVDL